jgi:hypothetical protein
VNQVKVPAKDYPDISLMDCGRESFVCAAAVAIKAAVIEMIFIFILNNK